VEGAVRRGRQAERDGPAQATERHHRRRLPEVSIRWDAFDARISATYRLCEPATFEHYIPAYAEGQP